MINKIKIDGIDRIEKNNKPFTRFSVAHGNDNVTIAELAQDSVRRQRWGSVWLLVEDDILKMLEAGSDFALAVMGRPPTRRFRVACGLRCSG